MNISHEQVRHIAALAKLRIDGCELEKWSEQMAGIIAFADRLNELDLQETDAFADPDAFINVFREDETKASYLRETILSNAPEQENGYYVVPKIVE